MISQFSAVLEKLTAPVALKLLRPNDMPTKEMLSIDVISGKASTARNRLITYVTRWIELDPLWRHVFHLNGSRTKYGHASKVRLSFLFRLLALRRRFV
jgi:hypothetical protein